MLTCCWDHARTGARTGKHRLPGFSIIELLVVVAIIAILTAIALPFLMSAVRNARLRGAGTDFAGILQQARMRAVQDDRFYSVYLISSNGLQEEFVDIYPQQVNGASGSSGKTLDPQDPVVSIDSEIVEQPASEAPDKSKLKQQLFNGSTSPPPVKDGSDSDNPVTFGPQGLPCIPKALDPFGTVCNSQGGLVAYWVFFQDSVTGNWEAVTITPAGRIQKWTHVNNNWVKL